MTWAWDLEELDPLPKMVLLALADQANDQGYCWPSQATLAARCSMGERTVRRHLKALQELGLITSEVRSSTSGRRSNVYMVHVGVSLESRLPADLAGCGGPVDNRPVDNFSEGGVSGGIPATGQSGRSRKRPDRPVAQAATPGRSLPATPGRLHRGTPIKNRQTGPDLVGDPGGGELLGESGSVGSGAVGGAGRAESGAAAPLPGPVPAGPPVGPGTSSVAGSSSPAEVAGLLGACLPGHMLALDPGGARVVAGLLRERIEAGWRAHEIQWVMDQPLPASTGRLSSLVAHRLRANVDPGLAPVVVAAAGKAARARAARERAGRVVAQGAERPRDPVFERALAQVRRESPGASMLEAARAAGELVQRWRAEIQDVDPDSMGVSGSSTESAA